MNKRELLKAIDWTCPLCKIKFTDLIEKHRHINKEIMELTDKMGIMLEEQKK